MENSLALGIGLMIGAFMILWLIDLELRQRRTLSELNQERQKNSNARIKKTVQKLSDAEIDALIDSHFSSDPDDKAN